MQAIGEPKAKFFHLRRSGLHHSYLIKKLKVEVRSIIIVLSETPPETLTVRIEFAMTMLYNMKIFDVNSES